VFFRSHLAQVLDTHTPPDIVYPVELPTTGVYHPGEDLTILGYFLDNSALGVAVRLTHLQDSTKIVRGVVACRPQGQLRTTCPLPPASAFTAYGEFLVSLEEYGSGQLLSDDHSMLILLVLPVPAIVGITPTQASVSSETGVGEAEQQLLQLRIDFDWGVAAGTPELELYKQNYLSEVRCRLGVLGAPLS